MHHEAASGPVAGGRQARWGATRRAWLLAAAVVLAVLFAAASARLFVWPATDPPLAADAVVVFAGKRERLNEGIRLLQAGVAPVLVVSDGGRPRSRAGRTCRNPPDGLRVVCVTPERSSTAAEAAAFAELAERSRWRTVALVTSTYHVRRASLLLERCYGGRVASVAAPRRNGAGLVADVLHEWAGLAAAVTVQRGC
jgi:uncharacterized SAM-binding protein YcdF (DUF218 family)